MAVIAAGCLDEAAGPDGDVPRPTEPTIRTDADCTEDCFKPLVNESATQGNQSASPAGNASAPPDDSAPALVVLPTGYDCSGSCFEPSVAIDGDGRILVSRGYTPSGLRVSEDGGATWQSRARPPVPEGRGPTTVFNQGDILLQTAPDGSVYYTLLYIDFYEPAVGSMLILDGMQIAATRDGGQTWHLNKYLSFRDGPGKAQAINPDRQWLAFGPDGDIYVSVNFFSPVIVTSYLPPFGIYAARSDDGGATWGDFAPVAVNWDRGLLVAGGAGRATVADDGTVYLPLRIEGPAPSLAIAASSDGGATWDLRPVETDGPAARMTWVPQASWHDGRLTAAWLDTDHNIWTASSTDGAASWTPAIRLAKDGVVGPWVESGPAGAHVTWSTGTADTFAVHVGRIDWGTNSVAKLTLATNQKGNHGYTDFSHMDLTAAGQPVVIWGNHGDDLYIGSWS